VLLGLAGLALAALLPAGAPQAQGTPKEIVIGGTISQSGPLQGIVAPFVKLAKAWEDRVNARGGIPMKAYGKSLPIRFVIYDDKSDPATTLSFYERLATVDKVDVFIGPFSSGLHNAALQASVSHKIPFFMVEGNDPFLFKDPNPWRVTGLAPADKEQTRMVQFLSKLGGLKTFAILARDNLHEKESAKGLAEMLSQAGFQVVYQETAPADTKDFASIVLAMKQKNPDAVVVEALAPPSNIQFLKQAREQGLNPKELFVSHAPVPVIKGLGPSSENMVSMLYSFDGDSADHKEFQELCKAAGFEPWQYSEAGIRYRAYRRIEDALERAGTLDKEAVRKAMWSTDLTLFGEEQMKHDATGFGTDMPYPVQVHDGKYVSLWPIEKGLKVHRFKDGKW
jgi:branched-chain amino acid transport system substrate-binding protein